MGNRYYQYPILGQSEYILVRDRRAESKSSPGDKVSGPGMIIVNRETNPPIALKLSFYRHKEQGPDVSDNEIRVLAQVAADGHDTEKLLKGTKIKINKDSSSNLAEYDQEAAIQFLQAHGLTYASRTHDLLLEGDLRDHVSVNGMSWGLAKMDKVAGLLRERGVVDARGERAVKAMTALMRSLPEDVSMPTQEQVEVMLRKLETVQPERAI